MSEKLKDALSALDPTNDEHWTQDGLPRLDVLKGIMGDTVTRADIFACAKSFNRSNTSLTDEEAELDAEISLQKGTVFGATQEAELQNDSTNESAETEGLSDSNVVTEELVLTPAERAEAELVTARKNFATAKNALHVAQETADTFRRVNEAKNKAVPPHLAIRAYQESQTKQRAVEVGKLNVLRQAAQSLNGSNPEFVNGLNQTI